MLVLVMRAYRWQKLQPSHREWNVLFRTAVFARSRAAGEGDVTFRTIINNQNSLIFCVTKHT